MICTKESAVWAWGHEPLIRKAFGAELTAVNAVEFGDRVHDLAANLYLKGFLEQGIAKALARGRPLLQRNSRSGSTLIIDRQNASTFNLDRLRNCVAGRMLHGQITGLMTSVTPHTDLGGGILGRGGPGRLAKAGWAFLAAPTAGCLDLATVGSEDATAFLDARCGARFNRQADALLSAWIGLLLPGDQHGVDHALVTFDGAEGPGNPRFVVNDRTAFSRRAR